MSGTGNPSRGPPAVVLVEDDNALAKALRFALEIEGWTVLHYDRGEAVLAASLPAAPFCIVCDLRLPGISGIETLQELRVRGVDAPAILITGHPSATEPRLASKVRARFVQKPLVTGELLGAIRDALV